MSHDNYARNAKQERDGYIWLFGAGTFALALWGFLVFTDHALSTSDREKKLGEKLRELRTAQAEVGSGVMDDRQAPALGHAPDLGVNGASIDTLVSRDAGHGHHGDHAATHGAANHGEASHDEAHHASEAESEHH